MAPDESRWCRSVFRKFEGSVVRLHYQRRYMGTGFVVHWSRGGSKCFIMSCEHVCRSLPPNASLEAFFSGSTSPSKLVVMKVGDANTDLALLRVTELNPEVRAKRPAVMNFFDHPVSEGWSVVLLGFQKLRRRSILRPSTWRGRITSEPHEMHILHTCTATNGLSGSPIVLAGVNAVVGVHAKRQGGTGYAIGVGTIRAFLERHSHVGERKVSIAEMLSAIAGPA